MLYEPVSSSLDFAAREQEMLKFWKDHEIFEKSIALREGAPSYTFYDGPPTSNGRPHIGHVLTRSIKDLIPRYRTMKGYQVLRKAGWDTHGLPVELEVEKKLGFNGKEHIENFGIANFNEECRSSVWTYLDEWQKMSDRVGFWADMDNPYVTYHNDYIESEWWAFKKIHEKGLLYKGYKVVPYCPRCGTALASHEVAQGYKDVKETSAIAKFRMKGEDTYILAWTTTPWTLPSNTALCVNAHEDYVKVTDHGETYIMAAALVEKVLCEDAEILATFKGSELEGVEYEPLMPFAQFKGKAHYVVCDDYVTLTDGTGIVHIAPAFGEDDARIGRNYNLPLIQLVDERGEFTGGTPWDGTFCKDADPSILEYLKERGLLFAALPYEHSYPFCWRCNTPLLYYARSSWFVKTTAIKDQLIANNRTVNWIPETIKEGRMGNWLENVIDWAVSRQRYWGTPIPVWECECGHFEVIGSREELEAKCENVPHDLDLHRPYIDAFTMPCPHCGKTMHRVPDVADCWFDSGSMPFAQWHYPFENKEIFDEHFPADFISEAQDQTRGWFYTLLTLSTLLFDKAPFKNCIVLGLVNDKNGIKMSKHLGNVVDPWSVLDAQGADAVRWYFYTGSALWLPSRFSGEAVSEAQRKFMGTLWNTYAFYVLYANIDGFNPKEHTLKPETLSVMDKWLFSRLNTLVATMDDHLENYRITEGGRALAAFVDDLSNWYVRRGRERYWADGMEQDKINAYLTLYTALETLTRLSAPYIPFMADEIYQNIVRRADETAPESVHLCDFPTYDASFVDASLEESMDKVLTYVTLGRAARNTASIKVRQPLSRLYILGEELAAEYNTLVADELNVEAVEYAHDEANLVDYEIKPQMRTLGPRLGKMLPVVRKALAECDGTDCVAQLKAHGVYRLEAEGQAFELAEADLLISPRQRTGLVSQSDRGVTVALDTALTPELILKGQVREVISKVQNMRKDAGFVVTDHIRLGYAGDEAFCRLMAEHAQEIGADVLADKVEEGLSGFEAEWTIDTMNARLSVERV